MSDYVVKFTGKDDLSNTVKNIKKELGDIGTTGKTAMDKIDAKFQKITQSTAPLKRQLRDLQNLMSEMNFKGLANTDQFTKIAIEAGRIKDAMEDASQAVRNYSNDTMALSASIQMLQGVAAAANVAVGTMALFGSENEDAVKAIRKVQGALATLNGVQQLANVLNKDSVLILKAKQIQQGVNAALQIKNNALTAANTAVVAANTAVTKISILTQKAWNVTTAIGKALLGDVSGLILVAAAGYTAYTLATSKSNSEQKELNNTQSQTTTLLQKQIEARKEATKEIDSEKNKINALYSVLTNVNVAYKDKARALEELKNIIPSVNGYIDSEAVYHGNAVIEIRKHIDALDDLQKALAAFKLGQKIQEEVTNSEFEKYQADQKVYRKQNNIKADEAEMNRHANDAGYTWQGGRSQAYIDARNRKEINEENLQAAKEEQKAADARVKNAKQQQEDYQRFRATNSGSAKAQAAVALSNGDANKAADIYFNRDIEGSRTSSGRGGGGSNTVKPNPVEEIKYAQGSLTDLENKYSDLQKKLKDGLIPEEKIYETISELEKLRTDITNQKIKLGLEIDPKIKEDEELKKKVTEQVESYFKNNQDIQLTPSISTFDKATGNNPFNVGTLDGLENMINFNDELISSLQESINKLEELKQSLVDAGLEGSEAFNSVVNELGKVNGELSNVQSNQNNLADSASDLSKHKKELEDQSEAWGNYSDILYGVSNALNVLGDSQEAQMTQFAVNTASILANAVSTIAAMNAEALAKGASSAFSLPFPANLAAWATVFTAITSIFASLPKFAEGGILTGGSTHGDTLLARVNAGEMILNPRQQSNLFKAIDNGSLDLGGGSNSFYVDWRIKGSDLYGTMKNYSKTVAKTGKNTGIR